MTGPIEVSVEEFFVEIHQARGNFSKFEIQNPSTGIWEELHVWDFRKADAAGWWAIAFEMQKEILRLRSNLKMLRVTRFPYLEQDVAEVTYHPSVPAWTIDVAKVKEYFNV